MKKQLLLCLLISMLSLNITGCMVIPSNVETEATPKTTKTETIPDDLEKIIEQDKTSNDVTPSQNTITDQIKDISDNLELYSDDTRIVFKNGQSTLVFGYKGNEITSYTLYIDYDNALTAKYVLSTLLAERDDSIKNAYDSGKYLVIEYNKSEFENTTLEEIKQTYSLLEQIKQASED